MSYRVQGPHWGQVVLFVVGESGEGRRMEVISADRGAEEGYELTDDPNLDLTLG